jgi:hypothetical protein
MYEYCENFDLGRLIYYEGDFDMETTDMYSYMYLAVDALI